MSKSDSAPKSSKFPRNELLHARIQASFASGLRQAESKRASLGGLWNWENGRMSDPRYERILASTALALILAAPIGAIAQDADAPATASTALAESGRVAAPNEPAAKAAEAAAAAGAAALSVAPAAPSEATSETGEAAPSPKGAAAPSVNSAIASEQIGAPDPLAALDPADRAVAEKIHDLLFANKRERGVVESFYQA